MKRPERQWSLPKIGTVRRLSLWAERNCSVVLRLLFMSSLDAPVGPCSRSNCPPPPDSHVRRSEQHCNIRRRLPEAERLLFIVRTSVRSAPAVAYGLAPCAVCVRMQHRASYERPLKPRCELQRHHPPEGR